MKITDPMQYLHYRASENDPDWDVEGFVLRHGKFFEHRDFDDDEHAVVDSAITIARRLYGRFEPRQCFANAQRLVLSDPSKQLSYVEGYVITDGLVLPIPHAWATINGKLVDVTLPRGTRRCFEAAEDDGGDSAPAQGRGVIPGRKYLGVSFLREYVEARMWATRSTSVLLVDHLEGRPVIASEGVGAIIAENRTTGRTALRPSPGGS